MELHNNIMFYLSVILFGVGWILVSIVRNYIYTKSIISNKYLNHGTLIELIWTNTPALILILIAFPSFKLLNRRSKQEPSCNLTPILPATVYDSHDKYSKFITSCLGFVIAICIVIIVDSYIFDIFNININYCAGPDIMGPDTQRILSEISKSQFNLHYYQTQLAHSNSVGDTDAIIDWKNNIQWEKRRIFVLEKMKLTGIYNFDTTSSSLGKRTGEELLNTDTKR
jgi:Cytochrome C oxidase subunit II, transmembrane domain